LALLKHTEQRKLGFDWNFADLVEEDRAGVCKFKASAALLYRAGTAQAYRQLRHTGTSEWAESQKGPLSAALDCGRRIEPPTFGL